MAQNSRPSHRVYVVEDSEADPTTGKTGYWTKIGAAWPHQDGRGLNVQLTDGIAVSGRIVLREYTEEDAKIEESKRKTGKK